MQALPGADPPRRPARPPHALNTKPAKLAMTILDLRSTFGPIFGMPPPRLDPTIITVVGRRLELPGPPAY
jgi:hypothetical protein